MTTARRLQHSLLAPALLIAACTVDEPANPSVGTSDLQPNAGAAGAPHVAGAGAGGEVSTAGGAPGGGGAAGQAGSTGGAQAGSTGGTQAGGTGGTQAGGAGGTQAGGTGGTQAGAETGGMEGSEEGGAEGMETGGMEGMETGGMEGTETGGMEGTEEGGAGSGEPGNYPKGNPPVLSAACGTPTDLSTGERMINSTNQNRVYYLDVPANYDENKPYRLFYISHWIGSRYQDMVNNNFYGLKTMAEAAGESAIFIAPSSDGQTWQEKDHALFDDLLAFAKENLCFDTSRVFATGFSFGGMITYSLSTNHQDDIRAAVGIAPANYNIWLPEKTREPIAWMQTTGMGDTTCPWTQNGTNGAKFIGIEKAEDNGCTAADVPTWQNGPHLCYDYEDCNDNHPVKVCTFNGGHQAESSDPGSNANWIPEVSWEFFTQF